MWDPEYVTTIYASTACYEDSFTLLLVIKELIVIILKTIDVILDWRQIYWIF
jgi:hypothetical protein